MSKSCRLREVAGRALAQSARVALQANEFEAVVSLTAGRDGMGAVVAALAIDVAMPDRISIQRLGQLVA